MTDAPHDRAGAARPALARLLGRTTPEEFAADIWGQTLHLAGVKDRGGDAFADVFSLAAVDELISERGLRTPFLRVAKNGTTLPDRAFTSGGGTGAGVADQANDDKLLRLFADGATIVLQGLHRTWAPIQRLSAALAADLGHPVQVNAYITPPQNQGFSDHYDVHDVFVLQIHGEKDWALREPVLQDPLRDQPWADRREQVQARAGEPAHLETTLRAGDCLYLPRGWIHSARARGGVSIHLTIGVHSWTRHHLAEVLLDQARRSLSEHDEVRRALPLGVDLTAPDSLELDVRTARDALLRAVETLPVDEVVRVLRAQQRAAQRPAPVAPLAQLAAADGLGASSTLRLREHLMLDVLTPDAAGTSDADAVVVLSSRAGRLTLPAQHLPAVELLLTGRPSRPLEMSEAAGLGQDEALDLARTLVRHGIAVAADDEAEGGDGVDPD